MCYKTGHFYLLLTDEYGDAELQFLAGLDSQATGLLASQ